MLQIARIMSSVWGKWIYAELPGIITADKIAGLSNNYANHCPITRHLPAFQSYVSFRQNNLFSPNQPDLYRITLTFCLIPSQRHKVAPKLLVQILRGIIGYSIKNSRVDKLSPYIINSRAMYFKSEKIA